MYMFATVSIMIIFILYKHYQQEKKIGVLQNNESIIKKSSNNLQLYSYCDDYIKTNKKILLENVLLKQINTLKYKNKWFDKIKLINNEFYNNKLKDKFKFCIDDINNKKHYCYWVYNNNIIELKTNKIIILDLSSVYDYEKQDFLNINYLINLSKFCHNNTIIFVVITELHPDIIIKYNFKYLNKNNITTPYHYKVKTLGSIVRLKENQLSIKPAEISINKIILDIFNRYGGSYNNTIYIGKTTITKLKSIIL